MARHRLTPHDAPAGQRLAGLPWLSLVLAGLVVTAAVLLLRPDTYLATATVGASDSREAARAAVDLTRPELAPRTEREMELGGDWLGRTRLVVERPSDGPTVLVTAAAPDPRLAALAADTAASLVVSDRPESLWLDEGAAVPTRPEGLVPWWGWAGAGGLVLVALVVEVRQQRRVHQAWAGRIVHGTSAAGEGAA